MSSRFITDIGDEVRASLARSIDALGFHELDLGALFARLAGEALVTLIVVALFTGAYLAASGGLRIALRKWAPAAMLRPLRNGLRYLFALALLLALMAQWDVSAEVLEKTARGGLIAFGFFAAWVAVVRLLHKALDRNEVDPSVAQLSKNALFVLFAVLAFATVRTEFGFDVLSIVAGLGIVGIAVGFAAQATLANFIAGVTILIEQPFRVGDWIRLQETEGQVVRIALRATSVRTRDNVYVTLPNQMIVTSQVVNLGARGPLRLRLSMLVTSRRSFEDVQAAVVPALEGHPASLQGEMAPRLIITGFGESSVQLEALVWIARSDIDRRLLISSELYERTKAALDAAGIDVPYSRVELMKLS